MASPPPFDVRAALEATRDALVALQRQASLLKEMDRTREEEMQLVVNAVSSLMETQQALAAGLRAHARSKNAHPHVHDHIIEEEDGTQWEPEPPAEGR